MSFKETNLFLNRLIYIWPIFAFCGQPTGNSRDAPDGQLFKSEKLPRRLEANHNYCELTIIQQTFNYIILFFQKIANKKGNKPFCTYLIEQFILMKIKETPENLTSHGLNNPSTCKNYNTNKKKGSKITRRAQLIYIMTIFTHNLKNVIISAKK